MSRSNRKAARVLLYANFLNVFGWALLTPLYALYGTQLGATPRVITFSWAFYTLLAGLLMLLCGRMEDRSANKPRILTGGYVLQTAGMVTLFGATNVQWLFAGLGLYAIGSGLVMPVWKQLYARKEERGKEATGWGIFHGINNLLIAGAAALSGILLTFYGFRGILALMVAAHLLAALFSATPALRNNLH